MHLPVSEPRAQFYVAYTASGVRGIGRALLDLDDATNDEALPDRARAEIARRFHMDEIQIIKCLPLDPATT